MSEMRLRALPASEPANWPTVLTHPATFTALDSWTGLANDIYHFPSYRFETEIEGQVTGLLALTHVRHRIFGNYLATAPFGSYGGFAFSNLESRDMLLNAAAQLAQQLGVEYANLRWLDENQPPLPPPSGWQQHPVYATFLLDLKPDPPALLAQYSADHRNHVRKSLKKGFTVRFGHLELLDDAYEALARSMHELGSPYHAKSYLRSMARGLADTLEFAVIYANDGRIAGGGVFIQHGSTVTNLHANILRAFRSDYAGECLYWQAIERYSLRGLRVFDLGRSLIGSGNETFKMKWRPRRELLSYWYWLRPGAEMPSLNQKNPKFAFAIATWKRLPAFVVRPIGPLLINGLA